MENERKAAAREYIEKFGLSVVLLEPKAKEPACKKGSNDACHTVERLEYGYKQFNADYNIGLATGSNGNGLIVIDCDKHEDGADGCEWLIDWQLEHGELPETATVTTGSGGVHLYYWNRSGRKIKNSANADIAVDVRGEGGYVMAPPSLHPNGNTVFWDLPPDEVPIAEADELVFELIDDVQNGKRVFDDCFELPEVINKHGRNDTLFSYGRSLLAKDTPAVEIYELMKTANKERCKPPLGAVEVKRTYNSVMSKPAGLSDEAKEAKAKAKKRGRPRNFEHDKVALKLINEYNACKIEGAPAVKIDGIYRTGWGGVDDLVYTFEPSATTSNLREVHNWLDVKAPTREISPWHLIAFQNGVFDLKAHEFREFADDDVFTSVIVHDYNKDAGTKGDLIHRFLLDVSGDDTAIHANLLETIGLCMLHVSRYEYAPVLLGRGANGKSVFMKFLRYVLGSENVASLEPKDIDKRFQAVQLVGKLANLSDDIANGYLDGDACSKIKNLATGDPIYTDVKGSNGFTFTPCCTLVFSANEFPRLADTSEGMMRRLFPISFTQRYIGERRDQHLQDKLNTEECAERAIYDAVEMLQLLIERGDMTPNETSRRIKQEIITDNSTVIQWIDDCEGWDVVRGKSKELAYELYADWARRNGVRNPVGAKKMCDEIRAYSGMTLCERAYIEGANGVKKQARVFGFKR
jgi:P4 family phage/plasmid primase-like protien